MMAARIKPAPKELYEEDFYLWTRRQAGLLRARRYDELDLEHLIEEVEDLGGAAKKSVRSRARTGLPWITWAIGDLGAKAAMALLLLLPFRALMGPADALAQPAR